MDYGQTKDNQVLPRLLTTRDCTDLRLRDYNVVWTIWLVDELEKTAVIRDFLYIVSMTKPGTNRHY